MMISCSRLYYYIKMPIRYILTTNQILQYYATPSHHLNVLEMETITIVVFFAGRHGYIDQ